MMFIVKKILNRIIKNISQISLLRNLADNAYRKKLKLYSNQIKTFSGVDLDLEIIEGLEENGIFITSLEELKISNTDKLLSSYNKLYPGLILALPTRNNQYYIYNYESKTSKYTNIYLWGLEARLLDIVEKYLGLPAAYHGIYLRKDLANNIVRKSRLWHIDKEDRKMLKIIIYFNDVDCNNGAFQYILQKNTEQINQLINYNHEYIKDEKMRKLIPESQWISCEGKAGTAIFVDTASVFHRGQLPKKSDRLALFFDYTTRYPLRPYYCKSSFPIDDLLQLSSELTPRQKACVFWHRSFIRKLNQFEANHSHKL